MNFVKSKIAAWTGAALCAALGGSATAQTVSLKSKFEPGKTCYVERATDIMQAVTGVPGQGDMKINIKQVFGVLQTVESAAPDKGAKLKLTFDRVAMKSDFAMMDGEFDSDSRNDNEMIEFAEIYSPLIGMAVTLEIDANGKATAFSGGKALMDKIDQSAGQNMMADQAKRGLSDEQGKVNWGDSRLMLYANKDVKVGDTWKGGYTSRNPNLGELATSVDCRLESVGKEDGRDVAVVSYSGTVKQTEEPKTGANGMLIKLESGKVSGKAVFDVKQSQFVKDASDTEMKLTAEGSMGDQKMQMSVELKQHDVTALLGQAEREKQKADNAKNAKKAEADKKKPE